jgi:lichenan operon transcriptional antiterminator
MIGRLTDSSKEGFVEDFYQQILKREELGSLIFAEGIAFPHPAKSLTMQEEIVVAICSKPLVWNEDGQEVSVVILLSPSLWENKHMKLLTQHLARLLDSTSFRERLLTEYAGHQDGKGSS